MADEVFCTKYKQKLTGLEKPPYPGPKGLHIFQNVSEKAWLEWQAHQTRLINEKHLTLTDPTARKYLMEQMDKFLAGEPVDAVEGYIPPSSEE